MRPVIETVQCISYTAVAHTDQQLRPDPAKPGRPLRQTPSGRATAQFNAGRPEGTVTGHHPGQHFGPCSRGAGTEVIARYQLPMVGVPDPTAIAKTCNAVIPLPAPALTVGSVTEATVLPACSGTDAK